MNRKAIVLMIGALFLILPFASFSEADTTVCGEQNEDWENWVLNFNATPDDAIATLNKYKSEGCEDSTWDNESKILTLNGVDYRTHYQGILLLPSNSTIDVKVDSTLTLVNNSWGGVDTYAISGKCTIKGDATLTFNLQNNTGQGKETNLTSIYNIDIENTHLEINMSGTCTGKKIGIHAQLSAPINITGSTVKINGSDTAIQSDIGVINIKDSIITANPCTDVCIKTSKAASGNLTIENSFLDLKTAGTSSASIAQTITVNDCATLLGSKDGSDPTTPITDVSTLGEYTWVKATPKYDRTATLDFTNSSGIEKAIDTLNYFSGEGSAKWSGKTLTLNKLNYVTATYNTFSLPDGATVKIDGDSTITVIVGKDPWAQETGYVFKCDGGKLIGNKLLTIESKGGFNESSYGNAYLLNFTDIQCNLELKGSNENIYSWYGMIVKPSSSNASDLPNLVIKNSTVSFEYLFAGILARTIGFESLTISNSKINFNNGCVGIEMGTSADQTLSIIDSDINMEGNGTLIMTAIMDVNHSNLNLKSENAALSITGALNIENCFPLLGSKDAGIEPGETVDVSDLTSLSEYKWLSCDSLPPAPEDFRPLATGIAIALIVLIAAGIYIVFFTKL